MVVMKTSLKAFTLLELLVAMVLMVTVAACLYSSLYTGFRARRSAAAAVEPSTTAANVIEILKQDISSALPPNGTLAGTFLGFNSQDSEGFDNDSLSFYTNILYQENEKTFGGTGLIELMLVESRESEKNSYELVRLVNTNLLSPLSVEAEEQVLCRNIRSMSLRYFDGFSWLDEWDSTVHENALPQAVEVDVKIEYRINNSFNQKHLRNLKQSFLIPCGTSVSQASRTGT